jgi:hypothetical protein
MKLSSLSMGCLVPLLSEEIFLTLLYGICLSPGLQVQACGYTGYDTIFPNMDHRCFWVDLLFQQALGHKMPANVLPLDVYKLKIGDL